MIANLADKTINDHGYDLCGIARTIAKAVATTVRTTVLQTKIEQMQVLVDGKERLPDQKEVLAVK